MSIVYISLGSNIGDKAKHILHAKYYLSNRVGKILQESSIIETDALGFEGYFFLNQVLKIETNLTPETLLQKTQEIEKMMGRTHKTVIENGVPVYQNRIIDIDILLYNDNKFLSETLTLPHPKMEEREFIMKLISEIRFL